MRAVPTDNADRGGSSGTHSGVRRAPLLLLLIGCAPTATFGCSSAASPDATAASIPGAATVVVVIDGDTVVLDIDGTEEHVRLIGIDTPEVFVDEGGAPECWGAEASAVTKSLLPRGTAVRLERDVVGRDDYGRLLAYVFLIDDQMVNETIVAAGAATPLSIAPNTAYAPRFVAAARAAEAAGLGLWGGCAG